MHSFKVLIFQFGLCLSNGNPKITKAGKQQWMHKV